MRIKKGIYGMLAGLCLLALTACSQEKTTRNQTAEQEQQAEHAKESTAEEAAETENADLGGEATEEETPKSESSVGKSEGEGVSGIRFTTQDLDGEEASQDIFADQALTMVNVWATFCSPCLQEMPDLAELHEEYGEQGFQIVGIVSDAYDEANIEKARKAAEATGAKYRHLLPSADMVTENEVIASVTTVPTTFFVDSEGNQVGEVQVGAKSKEEWQEIIEEYLELVQS